MSCTVNQLLPSNVRNRAKNATIFSCLAFLIGCGTAAPDVPQSPVAAKRDSALPLPDLTSASLGERTNSAIRLEDCARDSGIVHTYSNGQDAGYFSILESLGGGVAVWDFDNDDQADVFATGGGSFNDQGIPIGAPSVIFRQVFNAGELKFLDASTQSRIARCSRYSHGGIVSDFDNDGFSDILITGYGGVQLQQNMGDGTFIDSSGLPDAGWSSSAAWGDINGDGATDVYVVHYTDWSPLNNPECRVNGGRDRDVCPPRQFSGVPDILYLSNAEGEFIDASGSFGEVSRDKGLGVVTADIDKDGDLDVYVTNDTDKNSLLVNEGRHSLAERGEASGTAYGDGGHEDGSMGVDIGDYNRDGNPDIWVTNYENETFALYRNFNGSFFQHVSRSAGIAAAGGLSVGWGTLFMDLDLDGYEDIFAANGHVIRHPQASPLEQRPLVLANLQGRKFVDVANECGAYTSSPHLSRGIATGDLDLDGRLDIVISNLNQPLAVLRNATEPSGSWLKVLLIGTQSARHPIGARVEIELEDGVTLMRLQKGGTSFASTSQPELHFGLGKNKVRMMRVYWPSGSVQEIDEPKSNTRIRLIEGRSNATIGER